MSKSKKGKKEVEPEVEPEITAEPEAEKAPPEPPKPRTDAQLRKLAADIVNGLVYADFIVPYVPETKGTAPMVVHITHSGKVITPLDMLKKAPYTHHEGMVPDRATIVSLFKVTMFLDSETLARWEEWGVVSLFEYADKADTGTIINGLPTLWSVQLILRDEWPRLVQFMKEYEEMKLSFMGEPDEVPIEDTWPPTFNIRMKCPLPDGGARLVFMEFPVKSVSEAEGGCVIEIGYREGVSQNENISFGKPSCCIDATVSIGETENFDDLPGMAFEDAKTMDKHIKALSALKLGETIFLGFGEEPEEEPQ
jgi:hypothetical protein